MPRKDMPKAWVRVASVPFWKAPLWGLVMGLIFAFFSWLMPFIAHRRWDLTWPVIHLVGFTLLYMYLWWAWRPRRRHGRWLRWWGSVLALTYISALLVAAGAVFWNVLLAAPWNWIVNGASIALLILALVLPAISERVATRIAYAQDRLSFKMLAFGGPAALMVAAGILGANFGLHGGPSAGGQLDPRFVAIAFIFPICGIVVAQYNAHLFWPYRPWRKDEEA